MNLLDGGLAMDHCPEKFVDQDFTNVGTDCFVFLKQILVTISKSCDKFLQIETNVVFFRWCHGVEKLFDEFCKI